MYVSMYCIIIHKYKHLCMLHLKRTTRHTKVEFQAWKFYSTIENKDLHLASIIIIL